MSNLGTDNWFDLSSRVAVITGGYGTLGSHMAKGLSQYGAQIAILGRDLEKASSVAGEIAQQGGQTLAVQADVTRMDDVKRAREEILQHWGTIDILVNAAGGNRPGAVISPEQQVWDLSVDDLERVVDLNQMGTVYPSIVFARDFGASGRGVIVNISSMASIQAITRVLGYSMAKAAVQNFTQWMAVEMASKFGDGIRVNAIAPGFFVAEQNRDMLLNPDGSYTERGNKIIGNTPMGRFGEPEELVGTLIWLCGDASRFVTGTVIPVDGGFSAYSGV